MFLYYFDLFPSQLQAYIVWLFFSESYLTIESDSEIVRILTLKNSALT